MPYEAAGLVGAAEVLVEALKGAGAPAVLPVSNGAAPDGGARSA